MRLFLCGVLFGGSGNAERSSGSSSLVTSPVVTLAEVLTVSTAWLATGIHGCGGEGSFLGTVVVLSIVTCLLTERGSTLVESASELLLVLLILRSLCVVEDIESLMLPSSL